MQNVRHYCYYAAVKGSPFKVSFYKENTSPEQHTNCVLIRFVITGILRCPVLVYIRDNTCGITNY